MKLVKPRIFRAIGRTDVRKSQYMRGKGSGKSERQQDESSEENTGMCITRWIVATAIFRKEADFRWSSTRRKLKGVTY